MSQPDLANIGTYHVRMHLTHAVCCNERIVLVRISL